MEGEPDREDDVEAATAEEKRRKAVSEPGKNEKAKARGNRRLSGREESEEGDEEQPFRSSIKAKSSPSLGKKADTRTPSKAGKWFGIFMVCVLILLSLNYSAVVPLLINMNEYFYISQD
jgi:hypothetical protein